MVEKKQFKASLKAGIKIAAKELISEEKEISGNQERGDREAKNGETGSVEKRTKLYTTPSLLLCGAGIPTPQTQGKPGEGWKRQ